MVVDITPSPVIGGVINRVQDMGLMEGINATRERQAEFGSALECTLTGIALDPLARAVADNMLSEEWAANAVDGQRILGNSPTTGEVIIGSGYHAAVYAATRVRAGFPRPLVLEQSARVGGTFAMTSRPTFFLNSRNRPGGVGLAGDLGVSLNHLPGGIIQAANVGMTEFQTNTDMALAIRLTLAQYATVVPGTKVTTIDEDGDPQVEGYGNLFCGRLIIARGLGEPNRAEFDSPYVVSFPQLMGRMAAPWPMRGLRRVAVVGGGDSGKCAVEAFLGLSPQPYMACAALDHVERIDWYAPALPATCEAWAEEERGRYQSIGRYLRSDRSGMRRLNVVDRAATPLPLPDCAVIDGRAYDLVVCCTGNTRPGLARSLPLDIYQVGDEEVARWDDGREIYTVGPSAQLAFSQRERVDGLAEVQGNMVSMFRLGTKTALLAMNLDATSEELDN